MTLVALEDRTVMVGTLNAHTAKVPRKLLGFSAVSMPFPETKHDFQSFFAKKMTSVVNS
jgi:hypothetical protein